MNSDRESRIRAQNPRVGIDSGRPTGGLAVALALSSADRSPDRMLERARSYAFERGLAEPGRHCVVTAGVPFDVPGTTNYVRVETL